MMVCRCIKEIELLDNTKFIVGNYYTYEFNNNNYFVTKSGRSEYKIIDYKHILSIENFSNYFVDMSQINKENKVTKITKGPSQISVTNIVDNSIIKLLSESLGFLETKDNLYLRTQKLRKTLERDMKSCNLLKEVDPDILLKSPSDWQSVDSSRVKYHLYYISHCLKRREDITWCIKNRLKFYDFSTLQMFNLIKLKDKLANNRESEIM